VPTPGSAAISWRAADSRLTKGRSLRCAGFTTRPLHLPPRLLSQPPANGPSATACAHLSQPPLTKSGPQRSSTRAYEPRQRTPIAPGHARRALAYAELKDQKNRWPPGWQAQNAIPSQRPPSTPADGHLTSHEHWAYQNQRTPRACVSTSGDEPSAQPGISSRSAGETDANILNPRRLRAVLSNVPTQLHEGNYCPTPPIVKSRRSQHQHLYAQCHIRRKLLIVSWRPYTWEQRPLLLFRFARARFCTDYIRRQFCSLYREMPSRGEPAPFHACDVPNLSIRMDNPAHRKK